MSAPKCIGCPFRRDCPGCPWTGETPAAASWVPREGQAHVIHLPEPRTTSAWANREESTWIDKM